MYRRWLRWPTQFELSFLSRRWLALSHRPCRLGVQLGLDVGREGRLLRKEFTKLPITWFSSHSFPFTLSWSKSGWSWLDRGDFELNPKRFNPIFLRCGRIESAISIQSNDGSQTGLVHAIVKFKIKLTFRFTKPAQYINVLCRGNLRWFLESSGEQFLRKLIS